MSRSEPLTSRSSAGAARAQIRWQSMARSVLVDLLTVVALGLAIMIGTSWSYRQPVSYALSVEDESGLEVDGLGRIEAGDEGLYRWSSPTTQIRFPGVGHASYQATLLFHNRLTDTPRRLSIQAGTQQ